MSCVTPKAVFLILALGAFARATPAGQLKIIANVTVGTSEISPEDFKAIFLGTKTSLKAVGHLQPALVNRGPIFAELAQQYLGKTESGLQSYYRSLVFSGRGSMPPTFKTEADLVAYVATTPGAIACIQENTSAPGVKTLRLK